ncbi:MAG: response regulator [Actinomycetota bacterium]
MTATVVLADDEAIIRLDLKEILTEAGYNVVGEAGNGADALALIEEHQPDLALLDVKMPKMTGLEIAAVLSGRPTAVVLLTAFSQREMIDEARASNVAAYLVKPFRRHELLPALATVLQRVAEDRAFEVEVGELGLAAEDKLETRRIVDKAKDALEDAGLDEAAAFSFIQRTAMASRQRMREVAEQVLAGTLTP